MENRAQVNWFFSTHDYRHKIIGFLRKSASKQIVHTYTQMQQQTKLITAWKQNVLYTEIGKVGKNWTNAIGITTKSQ